MKMFLQRIFILTLFATAFLTAAPAIADGDNNGSGNDPIELPPIVCIYDPVTFKVIYCYLKEDNTVLPS